jgi:hypothetical protein
MSRIVYFYGVSKWIVFTRGTQFISKFWDNLPETMDIYPNFSSAYHPRTDLQTKRVTQILENILRAYALRYRGS